jgi:uncharacterized protein YndB with AHSA1/START domain
MTTAGPALPQATITRVFDAPRELVFAAFTDAKHLKHWWGPAMFTNPVVEADARPGGRVYIEMRAPDGTVFPMNGAFRELVRPERLVLTSTAMEDEHGVPMLEGVTTITFEAQGGRTKVTLHATLVKVAPQAAGAAAGMEQGWTESLDKLAAYLATVRK